MSGKKICVPSTSSSSKSKSADDVNYSDFKPPSLASLKSYARGGRVSNESTRFISPSKAEDKEKTLERLSMDIDEAGKTFASSLRSAIVNFGDRLYDRIETIDINVKALQSDVKELQSDVKEIKCSMNDRFERLEDRFTRAFGRDDDDLSHDLESAANAKLTKMYKRQFSNYNKNGLEIDCFCPEIPALGECSLSGQLAKLMQLVEHRKRIADVLEKDAANVDAHFFALWIPAAQKANIEQFAEENNIIIHRLSV